MNTELEKLGLTKNEAKIYVFLLAQGTTTTGKIIRETSISNSRVYESLNNLIRKGIVTYELQKDGKHFSAAPPHILLDSLEEKKKIAQKLLPQLQGLQNTHPEETTTAVYEGFNGFKTAFRKIIDDCPKNGEILIIAFSQQEFASESLRTFINNVNLKSIAKKQKLKMIFDSSLKKTFGKDREKEKYSEVRYMPEGYISPAAIDIMGDYVYTFLWDKTPYVFMIKNKKIANSYRNYFSFMWNIARKS